MTPPVLEVRSLSKSYRRRPVLRSVALLALPGEAIAIIGPNGAGKSTFLGCVTGERLPDDGTVRLCGHDPFSDPVAAAGCMGFVPEQPFLYPELTVLETLRFVVEIRRLDRGKSMAEMERLLDLLGLVGSEGVLSRELSQGMGRKVAIIAAMLHQPRVLILDEVFNGLDIPSTRRLLEELDRRRAAGSAVLLSSHDLELLAHWCDRGLLLTADGWSDLRGPDWDAWRSEPALGRPGGREPREETTEGHREDT
jgi:ABC-2 type transport system ATP-binding protein